ncbi:MAG TPA: hypothetical protein PK718_07150 [Candidatus Methanofastidiosa archaeon]|nr:hypothetical protein [Candidatus Methanofastidiosa archaeon]HPR42303.1 hypothetical protein [Candidatus Methanofastidiosa archaeon]
MDEEYDGKLPHLCGCESCKALLSTTEMEIDGRPLSIRGLTEILSYLALRDVPVDDVDFEKIYDELSSVNEDLGTVPWEALIARLREEYEDFI